MLTTITLYGRLGKRFGRKWEFDCRTVRDAISAIEMARPGFRHAVMRMRGYVFRVKIGKRYCSPAGELLDLPLNGREIRITPITEGAANSKGIWQIVAGVVLIAASFIPGIGPIIAPYAIPAGIGLILGGVANLLAPSPSAPEDQGANRKASYIFQGPINVQRQGGPVPILYGELIIGSVVISATVETTDVELGSNKGPPPAWNSGDAGMEPAFANNNRRDVS